jgi:hypothetical protein
MQQGFKGLQGKAGCVPGVAKLTGSVTGPPNPHQHAAPPAAVINVVIDVIIIVIIIIITILVTMYVVRAITLAMFTAVFMV